MASKVSSLRADEAVWEAVASAAKRRGMKPGPWIVSVIVQALEADGEAVPETAHPARRPAVKARAQLAMARAAVAKAEVRAAEADAVAATFGPRRAAPGSRLKRR